MGLAAGLRALHALSFEAIAEHEMALYEQLLDGLRRLGIEVLRIWPGHEDLVGVASFNVPGYQAEHVAAYLSAEQGIGVRGGKFCAHPLLKRFGLADTGAVRVSIGLGTGGEDVEAVLRALDQLLCDGPRWTYATIDGYLSPTPDHRPPADEVLLPRD